MSQSGAKLYLRNGKDKMVKKKCKKKEFPAVRLWHLTSSATWWRDHHWSTRPKKGRKDRLLDIDELSSTIILMVTECTEESNFCGFLVI